MMLAKCSILFIVVLIATLPVRPLLADENKKGPAPKTEAGKIPGEKTSVTHHVVTIGSKKVSYTATAGTLHLKKEDDKATAAVFYIAYTRDDVKEKGTRPITFSFNGGPGSSSVWLHLGLLGPKRVLMDDEGHPLPPPSSLIPNEYSLLDRSDLVFIDPVGTGYSRAAPGEDAKQFYGVEEDIQSVGEFVLRYVTRNQRWSSPKFLIGESYGTTRASGLVNYLQGRHGMYFNGIMLVSVILNFQTARFDSGNDLPYILFLPTYTATAAYHGKLETSLGSDLEKILDEARAFSLGEYATALLEGDALSPEKRERITTQLARFTGLSTDYIQASNLRITIRDFVDELLRKDYRRAGRLDSRFKGINRNNTPFNFRLDPSYSAIQGPYTATFNDYVRHDLKFESELTYEILGGNINSWNRDSFEGRYVDVSDRLRQAMIQNPSLKIFVANGYYDLATPFFATEYTFNHLNLGPKLRGNISMGYYEAGHMMYIRKASLIKLRDDLTTFFEAAAAPD